MKIESSAFAQNEPIPPQYTCDGPDLAPPLTITGVPASAKSIALVMDDPDAPGGTWVHWTVWNIPARESVTLEGGLPESAVQGVTSFGTVGYGGPCPPSGTHRYFFKAFALDTELDLGPESTAKDLERHMEGHILDKAGLLATYSRN